MLLLKVVNDKVGLTMVIGIDPGLTGAICVDGNPDDGFFIYKMPSYKKRTGGGYDIDEICVILTPWIARKYTVYIEHQKAFPVQGVTPAFTTGLGYGILLGICGALKLKTVIVQPKKWQEVVLGSTRPRKDRPALKAFAWAKAKELLRNQDECPCKYAADAVCIAEYGRMCLSGK